MSNGKITADEVLEKKVIDRFKELNSAISDSEREVLKVLKAMNKLEAEAGNIKTIRQARTVAEKEIKVRIRGNKAIQERIRISKLLEKQQAKNAQASGNLSRNLAKQRFEGQKLNKQTKQNAILTSRFADAYDKLSVRLNVAKRNLKNLTIEQGVNANATRLARLEVDRLGNKMRIADNISGDFQKNVGRYPGTLAPGIKAVKGLIGAFGIVEGLRLGFDFAKESIDLARQAKGVEFAFNRIGERGAIAFKGVKESTKGLLSNLDIKKSLVQFDNFGLSLERTSTLFKFLAVTATQTGESVEKLESSLVEGLSKESKLRIDNLGISTSELNAELERTSDFVEAVANIAERRLQTAGDILGDSANQSEIFRKSLENLKVSFGQLLQSRGFNVLGVISNQLDRVAIGFRIFDKSLLQVRKGINDFLTPIRAAIKQFPLLETGLSKASKLLSGFFKILTTPGVTTFALALRNLGAVLSGLGASFNAVKDNAIDFIRTLASFGEIDFTLNPLDNFKKVKVFFDKAKTQFVKGGTEVGAAFTKGYNDALAETFETPVIDTDGSNVPTSGNGDGSSEEQKPLAGTVAFLENLIKEQEKLRDKTAKTNEEYQNINNVIDSIREKIKELQVGDSEVKVELVTEARGLPGGADIVSRVIENAEIEAVELKRIARNTEEEKIRIAKESAERQKGILTSVLSASQEIYGVDLSSFIEVINTKEDESATAEEKEKARRERIAAYAQATGQTLLSLNDALLSGTLDRLDAELDANRTKLDKVLDDENASDEKKKAAQERYDQQEAEIKRKQFEADKKASIASTLINMAVAIVQAYAQLGPVGGTIAGVLITALAKVQVNNIKKQQPPQYFKGKKATDNFEGWATVGEKGREVILGGDGSVEVTPPTTTPRWVKRDDIIIPSIDEYLRDYDIPETLDFPSKLNVPDIPEHNFYQSLNRTLAEHNIQRSQMISVSVDAKELQEMKKAMLRMEAAIANFSNKPISINNKVKVLPPERKGFGF